MRSFVLPDDGCPMILEQLNSHPLDSRVTYNPKVVTHNKFSLDGLKMKNSVTSVVAEYFNKFDPDAAIKAMKGSGDWPRDKYLKFDRRTVMSVSYINFIIYSDLLMYR